jgi:hypothetical protein
MKRFLSLLLIVVFIQSCGMPMGDRVDAENLKVYYMEGVDQQQAIRFARYWRDNGFIGDRQQYIQLSRDEHGIVLVKLIEREMYREDELSIIELSLIQQLQRDLASDVFEEEVEVVITGDRF